MKRVRCARTVRRRVSKRADDLQLLNDRPRPSVRDDQRQRLLVLGPDVYEMKVETIDFGDEVRQGIQRRLALAPVVVRPPIAREFLDRLERDALRIVADRLALGPPGRGYPSAQLSQVGVRKAHLKRANSGLFCSSSSGHPAPPDVGHAPSSRSAVLYLVARTILRQRPRSPPDTTPLLRSPVWRPKSEERVLAYSPSAGGRTGSILANQKGDLCHDASMASRATDQRFAGAQPQLSIRLVGGPTAILEYGGLRWLTDPTLSPPGEYGGLTKLTGPALDMDQQDPIDVVLLSHHQHTDNLDPAGRAFLASASRVLSTTKAADELGGNVVGMEPWTEVELESPHGGTVKVTAVHAQHGPDGSDEIQGPVLGSCSRPQAPKRSTSRATTPPETPPAPSCRRPANSQSRSSTPARSSYRNSTTLT
jgi:hypothetical protein